MINHRPCALDLVAGAVLSAGDLLEVELQTSRSRIMRHFSLMKTSRTTENHMNWPYKYIDFIQYSSQYCSSWQCFLPKVRPLARHLKLFPIRLFILLRKGGVAEELHLVVCIEKMIDHRAQRPQDDPRIWTLNGSEAAVGSDADVWLFVCFRVFCFG